MQIEKKLILCSILAISIGIATIVPLAYVMGNISTAKAQTDEATPWFNLNVPYAIYTANVTDSLVEYPDGRGPRITYTTAYDIKYNATKNPEASPNLEGARVEFFEFQIYSDLGSIENITLYVGANGNGNTTFNPLENFQFSRENWFNISEITANGGAGGLFIFQYNGTLGNVFGDQGWLGGTGGSSSSSFFPGEEQTASQKFQNTYYADKIYIDVRRVGFVSFIGNSTIVTLADNSVFQHLELTRQGDQFIYGTLPPPQ
ncbi:MAG: hypothetical protein NWE96_09985 [Candidatus Bathyarchaeota archaeon]|nr:hypothetical protein [Candidatus Bathyarchaeota archaeon]